MANWNQQVIDEFRANEGRVNGIFSDVSLVLLHNVGAKSGKERINPLVSVEDDGRLIVTASKAGAPSHPDWYYNVVANPDVRVEYGAETFAARATVAEEPERTRLYAKLEAVFPRFTTYKEQAERTIPVIILTRQD